MSTDTSAAPARPRRGNRPPPRRLEVVRRQELSSHLLQVTVGGPGLEGFEPGLPSSYVKLFLPRNGRLVLPTFGPNGPEWPSDEDRPWVRTYTPYRHRLEAGELDLVFVRHGEGPAATWAESATPGDELGLGGPGPGWAIPADAPWFVLAGDEAALPAIATIAAALPAGRTAHVIVEVPADDDRLPLPSAATLITTWRARGADDAPGSLLEAELRSMHLPLGPGHLWVATESAVVRRLRSHLVDERGVPRERLVVRGYWRSGVPNHPDHDYAED